mgnify:CR=1 FL=1
MKNIFIGILTIAALTAGYFIGKASNKVPTPLEKKENIAVDFTMDSSEIIRLHGIFKKNSQLLTSGKPDSTITNFITFDRSIFEAMGDFFNDPANLDVSGVRCFMIQYDKKYIRAVGRPQTKFEIKGKKYENQNSIVFVPVDTLGRTLYNRWGKNKSNPISGYNHGELCPENCYNEIP